MRFRKYDAMCEELRHLGWNNPILEAVPASDVAQAPQNPTTFHGLKLADKAKHPDLVRKIQGCSYRLYNTIPFIGAILRELDIHYIQGNPDCNTMAVDKYKNIFIDVDFANSLSVPQIIFVLAHEALHHAMESLPRMGGRDPLLWNYATDARINWELISDIELTDINKAGDVLKAPAEGILCDKNGIIQFKDKTGKVLLEMNVKDKTAEEIYYELEKILQGKPPSPGGSSTEEDDKPWEAPQPPSGGTPPPQPPDWVPPPWKPRMGEPIYNDKTGEYGVITKVNKMGSNVSSVEVSPITREQAKTMLTPKSAPGTTT